MRVCIVTAEIHGLFKNGGIGTANTGLARELAAAAHEVVVAYVDPGAWTTLPTSEIFRLARERWRDEGVFLDVIPRCARLKANVEDVGWSYSTFDYLQARSFDVVLFNECGGQGYYAMLAKSAGVYRDAPRMIVVAHGPSDWARELNAQLPGGYRSVALAFLERRSVELADQLVSPSHYLMEWMGERKWRLPSCEILQNIVPAPNVEVGDAPQRIDELVFFGRLESRKGIELFCDAVEALDREGRLGESKVTFLGKFSRVDSVHSGVFLLERTKGWRVAPSFVVDLNQAEAIEYLRRPGALAVIPSLAENSPCVVVECLLAGVPFLASDSGGTAELVAEVDRARCLAPPGAEAFATRLREIVLGGQRPARTATPQAETRSRWRDLVARGQDGPATATTSRPRVTVCISVRSGEEIEQATLDSILAQTGAEVEISVVVYDAPEDRRAEMIERGTRLSRRSADRAAARNAAARAASGEWLMFAPESGWQLEPYALTTLARAVSRLDIEVACALAYSHSRPGKPSREWDGEIATLPLGPAAELAAFENCMGDEIFLISTGAFAAVGGFESGVGAEVENRHLLTRALIAGVRVDLVPTPLGWLRQPSQGRTARVSEMRRVLGLFAARPVGEFTHVFESVLSQGQHQIRARAQASLAPLNEKARELAMKLTFSFPGGEAASYPTFLAYALERNRIAEALDFARRHNPETLLPIAETAAKRAAEHAMTRFWNASSSRTATISLTAELSERLRLVQAPPNVEIVRDGRCVAAHRLAPGLIVAKAPLALPPGVERVEAWLDFAGDPKSEFALVAAVPSARVELQALEAGVSSEASFSDWRRGAQVTLESFPAARGALDLFLLTRTPANANSQAWAAWRRIEARVEFSEVVTPSAIVETEARYALPLHILRTAEVLTDASDFAFGVFTPGEFTQHHPLPGRPAVVRIRNALPAGASGIAAAFSVENERAHPIAFAFWLRAAGSPAKDEAGLANSAAASGWRLCPTPFEIGAAEARLPSPARAPMDLYLATKVVGFDDIFWCHAFWREIVVLESLKP